MNAVLSIQPVSKADARASCVRAGSFDELVCQLRRDREDGSNAIVYDEDGRLTKALADLTLGDRVLELEPGLLPGDVFLVDSLLACQFGQMLFLSPRSRRAAVAGSVLLDYAAHRMLLPGSPPPLVLCPGAAAQGVALGALVRTAALLRQSAL